MNMLIMTLTFLLVLSVSVEAFSPLGLQVDSRNREYRGRGAALEDAYFRNHKHHSHAATLTRDDVVTLADVVCEIATIMRTPIDCESIVVGAEVDDVIKVDFEVGGSPANMVFTVGCQDAAEAYMKFQALLQQDWQPMFYKERVIDFFAHREWVSQADSTHCNVVSFSFPETEHTLFMQSSCVKGLDCLAFETHPNGRYSLKGSGIEVHTRIRNANVSFLVEEISKNFDFRTAIVPKGLAPTFHAVDLPGQSTGFPDIANVIVPQMMTKRLGAMSDLLIDGEADPNHVALWPIPELVASFPQKNPRLSRSAANNNGGGASFMDKLCSCPVFETACKTINVEYVTKDGAMVVKFQHDPNVAEESEIWVPDACSRVLMELSHIAWKTQDTREFLTKLYHTPSVLEDLASDKCSMFKFDMPFAQYRVHGSCGETNENRDCIHVRPSEEGTTKLEISDFTISIVHSSDNGSAEAPQSSATMRRHYARVNRTQNERETSIHLHVHDVQVDFNVRTASIIGGEESVNVDVHIGDHIRMDDTLAEMLAWVQRVEIIEYVRHFMEYLRDGMHDDDDALSLWPWDYANFRSGVGDLGLIF